MLKARQFSNVPSFMIVTLLVPVIFSTPMQSLNAYAPSSSTVLGNEIDVMPLNPLNAFSPIAQTGVSSIYKGTTTVPLKPFAFVMVALPFEYETSK